MQKSQIVTNRKQKASSAATLKASHLKIVSERDTNMNSTVVNQNNQAGEAWAIAYEAKRVAKLVTNSAYALKSIGRVIDIDTTNKCSDEEGLSGYILGGLTQAIEIITDKLEDAANDLGEVIVKEGFDNE